MHATTASEVDAPAKADMQALGAPVALGPVQAGGGVHSDATHTTSTTPANATSTSGEVTSSSAPAAAATNTASSTVGSEPSTDVYVPTAPTPANPSADKKSAAGGLLSRFTENFKGDK